MKKIILFATLTLIGLTMACSKSEIEPIEEEVEQQDTTSNRPGVEDWKQDTTSQSIDFESW